MDYGNQVQFPGGGVYARSVQIGGSLTATKITCGTDLFSNTVTTNDLTARELIILGDETRNSVDIELGDLETVNLIDVPTEARTIVVNALAEPQNSETNNPLYYRQNVVLGGTLRDSYHYELIPRFQWSSLVLKREDSVSAFQVVSGEKHIHGQVDGTQGYESRGYLTAGVAPYRFPLPSSDLAIEGTASNVVLKAYMRMPDVASNHMWPGYDGTLNGSAPKFNWRVTYSINVV